MKKNVSYTIGSIIILIIVVFAFVILTPTGLLSGNKDPQKIPAFGKYNNKEIRYEQGSDFADFVSQYGQMFQQYGQQIDSSTYYYIFNYAFNSTVMKLAYNDYVKNSGYKVPKSAVNRAMVSYFTDENGKYSSKIYKQTPDSTIRQIRTEVETNLVSQRFSDDNFGSSSLVGDEALYGIKESDAELNFLKSYSNVKRGFNMAVLPLSNYPAEEKAKFGKENAAMFNKYDMSIITVEDESTAKTVAKRLANNEITFEDAVSEYSEKYYSNTEGKLTNSLEYQIGNFLENDADLSKVTSLSIGSVSEVIQTALGYSIFKADGAVTAPDFTADDMISTVGSYLASYENTRIEDYFSAIAKDLKAKAMATSFADACEEMDIDNVEIAPFPLNYGSVSVSESVDTSVTGLSGADKNEKFLTTAFSLKKNEISEPLVMNDNIVVLQFTTEETASADDNTHDVMGQLENFDEDSSREYIMASPKLKNNFAEVYFNHIMK